MSRRTSTPFGFAPLEPTGARALILGSFPSPRSLERGEYYAHDRNRFWPLMAALFDFPPDAAYHERCAALLRRRIALWDVLASCRRDGALDTAILRRSEVPNRFDGFLPRHPRLRAILLNGAKAGEMFARHVRPRDDWAHAPVCLVLPSTSPANAAFRLDDLVRDWGRALDAHAGEDVMPAGVRSSS